MHVPCVFPWFNKFNKPSWRWYHSHIHNTKRFHNLDARVHHQWKVFWIIKFTVWPTLKHNTWILLQPSCIFQFNQRPINALLPFQARIKVEDPTFQEMWDSNSKPLKTTSLRLSGGLRWSPKLDTPPTGKVHSTNKLNCCTLRNRLSNSSVSNCSNLGAVRHLYQMKQNNWLPFFDIVLLWVNGLHKFDHRERRNGNLEACALRDEWALMFVVVVLEEISLRFSFVPVPKTFWFGDPNLSVRFRGFGQTVPALLAMTGDPNGWTKSCPWSRPCIPFSYTKANFA